MLFSLVLVVLAGFVRCQTTYNDCSAIPGVTSPTVAEYVKYSPYLFYWILTGFDCSTVVSSFPRVGFETEYAGSSVIVNTINNQATFFNLLLTNDTKAVHVLNCSAGCVTPQKSIFNTIAYSSNGSKFFACHTVCNGSEFLNFLCITNCDDYKDQMQAVVDSVRTVPNGEKIHLAQQNCTTCTQCPFLNMQ